jgi:antitoxin VapB
VDKRKISRSGRPEDWTWLDSLVNKLDEDFIQAANEQPEQQERPALDRLFK